MNTYIVTYFDNGLKSVEVDCNLSQLVSELLLRGISDWSVTKIELKAEKVQ